MEKRHTPQSQGQEVARCWTAKERKRREKGTCLFNFLRYVFVVVRSIVFRTQLAHGRSFSDVDMTHTNASTPDPCVEGGTTREKK